MKVIETALEGVLIIEPDLFGDSRGFFSETWNRKRYAEHGVDVDFVQDNLSLSAHGVLRGLHFQNPHPQGKLVQVLEGEVYDVAVDIRIDSPTFKQWIGVSLSADNHRQLYLPEGFAHGFCVVSKQALFSYKCTDFYNPESELGLSWNDPQLAIEWPLANPEVSARDAEGKLLSELIEEGRLPRYSCISPC